jgi:uncharacterized protein YndB with AHSA1/START domain
MMGADDDNQENKVVIRRRIEATREELFDAWVDPEGMKAWMCPGNITSAEVHLEARVGGKLVIIMRGPVQSFEHHGEFKIIDRPSKLAFSWLAKATDWRPTLVTIELFEINENLTELVLTHEELPRTEVREQYRGGWQQILAGLEEYIRE